MQKRINWKSVQKYYNENQVSLAEVSQKFGIGSTSSYWKAKKRGDFIPRKLSDAMQICANRGKIKIHFPSETTRKKIAKTVNEHISNGTWHISLAKNMWIDYKGVKLHGTWEVAYAKWLDQNHITWRRPTETFKYKFQGKIHRYTPDFYLKEEQTYVEVKGYETKKDQAKWKQFPLKLKVLKQKEIKALGFIK